MFSFYRKTLGFKSLHPSACRWQVSLPNHTKCTTSGDVSAQRAPCAVLGRRPTHGGAAAALSCLSIEFLTRLLQQVRRYTAVQAKRSPLSAEPLYLDLFTQLRELSGRRSCSQAPRRLVSHGTSPLALGRT